MDTIFQVAFGTKVDSLSDPANPIIRNSKQIFSNDLTLGRALGVLIVLIAPKYGISALRAFGAFEWLYFFEDFSLKIIRQKREELRQRRGQSQNGGTVDKANNFLEMLIEAEAENEEHQPMNGDASGNAGQRDGGQSKKCKFESLWFQLEHLQFNFHFSFL